MQHNMMGQRTGRAARGRAVPLCVVMLASCTASTSNDFYFSRPTCAPATFAPFVGQPESSAVAIPGIVRIIPEGSPVTTDFLPDRTNVDVDAEGRITRLWCG